MCNLEELFGIVINPTSQVDAALKSEQIGQDEVLTAFEGDGEGVGEVGVDGGWILLDDEEDGNVVDHYQVNRVPLLGVLLGLQAALLPCLYLSQDIGIGYALLPEIILLFLI